MFRIPDDDVPRFEVFAQLTEQQYELLLKSISNAAPQLTHRKLISELKAADDADLPFDDVIPLLISLHWLRADRCIPEAELAAQVSSGAEADDRFSSLNVDWSVVQARLEKFLSLDRALGVTARAALLSLDYPHLCLGSRIITDARPVFPLSVEDGPSAFIITHAIRLVVRDEGAPETWVAALDMDDLLRLKRDVDRAIEKEASLRSTLGVLKLPLLSMGVGS
ncbi:MAG: hypothetical protein RL885_33215 [Planctomycetota bacterium]